MFALLLLDMLVHLCFQWLGVLKVVIVLLQVWVWALVSFVALFVCVLNDLENSLRVYI